MASKATSITLFSLATPPMRAFHLTWMAFFVCFFAWFACAPLMPIIKGEFGLSLAQVANINIAAVAITILVRLIVGPMCDRYGPRKTYTGLLLLGAIPVLGVAASQSYESFLFFRLGIGAVGASFVITQYHTSVMFAPRVVGTANAAAAGWGNAGGGAAQALMPLMLGALVMLGVSESLGWRVALLVPGVLMLVMAALYWRFTQDCPEGNYSDLRKAGIAIEGGKKGGWASFKAASANYRVWLLFVTYGACFGIEIFIHNIAAVYYVDHFGLSLKSAGLAAGSFGLLALFARALGGWMSDKLFKGNRAVTGIVFMILVTIATTLYWLNPAGNPTMDMVLLIAIGFLIYGPVMLIGLYALELAPKKAAGTAAGFTGLFGYLGGTVAANAIVGYTVDHFGWDGGFMLLIGSCVVSVILFVLTMQHGKRQDALNGKA